ncbi:MAG: hypothetical protein WCI41_04005 [bacterium]
MEEEKQIAIKTIQDAFSAKEKFFDYEFSQNFQLSLSQLDFLKTISTLVIALLGIGYFLDKGLKLNFLIVSLMFSLITLFGTISYIREMIDSESKLIRENSKAIQDKMNELININIKAIRENNFNIANNYAKEELLKIKENEDILIYTGEIFTFCFYNSVIFLLLAFFAKKYNFELNSIFTLLGFSASYLLSFRSWASKLIKFLSKNISSQGQSL